MFSIEIPCCDLSKIYNGQQSYRWKKINENKYIVIDGKKIVLVEQRKNKKYFICSEESFFDYWFNYFDCNFDYGETIIIIKQFYKKIKEKSFFFGFMIKENRRYRMVKNDLFETMIYYAIDEKNRNEKFEKFLHIQNDGTEDYIIIICCGMNYPEKAIRDLFKDYNKIKEKLNTGLKSFGEIFEDITVDEEDEFNIDFQMGNIVPKQQIFNDNSSDISKTTPKKSEDKVVKVVQTNKVKNMTEEY